MQATPEQLKALLGLQEVDRIRCQAESRLSSMPHKQQVLDGRTKRKEVQAKFDQVDELLGQARAQARKIADEDERLAIRQDELQEKIDEAQGDYRSVAALTRDLEGAAKRRETLEFQAGKAAERIAEIEKVHAAAKAALDQIDAREKELVADYQAQTAELSQTVQVGLAKRALLVEALPADVLQAYEAALAKCEGIGLAKLEAGKCSACRSIIDPNRLLQVKKEAPVSSCPQCGRVLIVEQQESGQQ